MSNNYSTDLEASSSQSWSITGANQTGLNITGDFTYEAWIKLEQLPSSIGDIMYLYWRWPGGGIILSLDSSDKLFARYGDGSGNTITFTDSVIVDNNDVGDWIHISVAVDVSAQTFDIRKNGVSQSNTLTSSDATSIVSGPADLEIGQHADARYFDGKMNNVRIWSDIRTSQEISDNYEKILSSEDNLEGSWFNETNNGNDLTSNGNDLTNNNSATFSDDVPFEELEPTHVANITIDHTKVDSDLTDFPIFIDLSDLPDSFWDVVANGGGDIRIFKEDGTTELAREIVSCDTGAKTGEMHLNYDGTLSSSSDITIQVWADGSSSEPASDSTYGSENVWSDYTATWHMKNGTDSTANNNDGTAEGGVSLGGATGQIGEATDFNGISDYMDCGAMGNFASDLDTINPSFSFWIKTTETAKVKPFGGRNGSSDPRMFLELNRDVSSDNVTGTMLFFLLDDDGNWLIGGINNNSGFTDGNQHKITVQADGLNNTVKIYVDGESQIVSYALQNTPDNFTENFTQFNIGAEYKGSNLGFVDAIIDEFRINNSNTSASWESTEYNNQSSPSTFYTASEPSPEPTTNESNFFQFF